MKMLLIGGGGREHAIAWRLAQDRHPPELFCAPGNAGTAACAVNLDLRADDYDGLLAWAAAARPDLTVVGPEAPLCAGLADRFAAAGLRVFGPSQAAAQLEGSKVFSKDVLQAAGVPTAAARVFTTAADALAYVRAQTGSLVVKAEGLAAGKGVYVCADPAEAERAVNDIMVRQVFGAAGRRVLIEEKLDGEEVSILALVSGRAAVMLASAQDHKRVFDGDAGPNTGGMGAYSPAPLVTADLWRRIRAEIFDPTLAELRRRGIAYQGVLYAGLMIAPSGPRVLEFNCRFGDPETQAILPRLEGDFAELLMACAEGRLEEQRLRWRPKACVCVVIAANGYPGAYATGQPIAGLDEAGRLPGVTVFHAGPEPSN